jgi:predicted metal-dependent RNase
MPDIKVTPLGMNSIDFYFGFNYFEITVTSGAGQDVGRSCVLVSIGSKNVMLDCGMHMGYNDEVCPLVSTSRYSSQN